MKLGLVADEKPIPRTYEEWVRQNKRLLEPGSVTLWAPWDDCCIRNPETGTIHALLSHRLHVFLNGEEVTKRTVRVDEPGQYVELLVVDSEARGNERRMQVFRVGKGGVEREIVHGEVRVEYDFLEGPALDADRKEALKAYFKGRASGVRGYVPPAAPRQLAPFRI